MISCYKNTGSVAHYPSTNRNNNSKIEKMMLSFAKPTGEKGDSGRGNKIDYANAIVVGMGYHDLCALKLWIVAALKVTDPSTKPLASIMFHRDMGTAGKKTMNLSLGNVDKNGIMTYGISVSMTKGDEKTSIPVFLSVPELYGLGLYADKVIEKILEGEMVVRPNHSVDDSDVSIESGE